LFIATQKGVVQGSFIGTDISGAVHIGNPIGIHVSSNSNDTTLGGITSTAKNVISGNLTAGVVLDGNSLGNKVLGNVVGTDVTELLVYRILALAS
jgi:titin